MTLGHGEATERVMPQGLHQHGGIQPREPASWAHPVLPTLDTRKVLWLCPKQRTQIQWPQRSLVAQMSSGHLLCMFGADLTLHERLPQGTPVTVLISSSGSRPDLRVGRVSGIVCISTSEGPFPTILWLVNRLRFMGEYQFLTSSM